jgi:DNA-3-methyladenine glycosylase
MDDNLSKILAGPAEETAPRLLGCWLVRQLDGQKLVGRIVETEAYDQNDVGSHSYHGQTPRTAVMFGPPGFLEPLRGQETMSLNRRGLSGAALTNGPAKLCQALGIDKQYNGHDLRQPPLKLIIQPRVADHDVIQTTRIGITHGQEVPWRFYLRDNSYVSKP